MWERVFIGVSVGKEVLGESVGKDVCWGECEKECL